MRKQIKRISIGQTSKVAAILYVLFGFIYTIFGILIILFGHPGLKTMGIFYLFMPIISGVLGYIFAALGCLVYNIVAGMVGGVEFEVTDVDAPQS